MQKLSSLTTKELFKLREYFTSKRLNENIQNGNEFDTKFAAHTLRLLYECEQILEEGDLDLRRNSETLKAVRNGEYTETQIRELVDKKLPHVEDLYQKSKLPYTYDDKIIRSLLLSCLEHHFGTLDKCVTNLDKYEIAIQEIKKIVGNI